jgi:hypothetical protein
LPPLVTTKLNVNEIIEKIDAMCLKSTSQDEVDFLLHVENQIRAWSYDAVHLAERLSRLSYFETLSDAELETLKKFHSNKQFARPGRKSTVKQARFDLEYALEWFFKSQLVYIDQMAEIEAKYPKSIVYKALRCLCGGE